MTNYRPILYILLTVILFTLWTDWEHWRPAAASAPTQARTLPTLPGTPGTSLKAPGTRARPQKADTTISGQRVTVATDTYTAVLNTHGADFSRLSLDHYFADDSGRQHHYALLTQDPKAVFLNQNGLLGYGHYPNQTSLYSVSHRHYAFKPGQARLHVRFHWAHGSLAVTKVYTFTRNSYTVPLRYIIHNKGSQPVRVYLYNQFLHGPPPKTHFYHSAPIYIGGAFYSPTGKYQKVPFPHLVKHPLHRRVTGGWVAVSQHYFLGAAIPTPSQTAIFYSSVLPGPHYLLGYKTAQPLLIAPGATASLETRLFLGPKQPSLLKAVAPGLDLTVDYGWLTVLAQPLYWVLAHIEHVLGNWGASIILLTVLIKVIFFPLSAASFKSMAKMRKLQPRMAALKERHGADKTALQQAMMELYKQEKMNPLGGCLPMIVQIPVFIALYWVLLNSVALRDAPFILWIHNLAAPDPYFVLPILMGISMLVQQLLNPAMMDPTQRKVMMIMPVIFTVFFLFFPAGLVLYWVTNNVLSILQQQWVMSRVDKG